MTADDQAARVRSMLAHPAGKGLPAEGYPSNDELRRILNRDNQPDIERFLENVLDSIPQLDPFEEEVHEVMAGLAALLISKQADYGPDAINNSPGGALVGINVRMHDKLSRAAHLRRSGATEAQHESLVDTYRDLANYGVIAVMVLEGTWPE